MLTIQSLQASVHRFPVRVPLLSEAHQNRTVVICRVETDDGYVGYGLTGHFLASAVVTALHDSFLPLVKGMDARDVEAIHAKVWTQLNKWAMTGVISSALSSLDIALWDIQGKAVGRTIAQLMGGYRDWAPTYVTFGFPEYDIEQLVESAKVQVAAGHTSLKLLVAVANGGPAEDAKRVRAVREAVGDEVELMIDANTMYSPVEALVLCRAVEDCNLTWFEEPLHANDARALSDLRHRTAIPISAGQLEGHRWRLRELVLQHAVDILQPNVCFCGGYTEARKAAHLAQAFNLPIANGGGWPRFNMHTMAGLMNGGRVEFHLDIKSVEDQIFVDPPDPSDGIVRLPTAPGLGMEVRADALSETKVRT